MKPSCPNELNDHTYYACTFPINRPSYLRILYYSPLYIYATMWGNSTSALISEWVSEHTTSLYARMPTAFGSIHFSASHLTTHGRCTRSSDEWQTDRNNTCDDDDDPSWMLITPYPSGEIRNKYVAQLHQPWTRSPLSLSMLKFCCLHQNWALGANWCDPMSEAVGPSMRQTYHEANPGRTATQPDTRTRPSHTLTVLLTSGCEKPKLLHDFRRLL